MTENKRFTLELYEGTKRIKAIKDNGEIIYPLNVVELLNELHKENKEFRKALTELKEIGDYQANRIKELQGFEDIVFNSLNGKIKRGEKAIEWGESIGADVGAMGFHIELLKQFKKELEKY